MSHFQNIQLENYRNFINFKSNFIPGCNVLIGNNGSGKTNILESLSLFDKGRGFRKENLENIINYTSKKNNFNVSSLFCSNNTDFNLSFSIQTKNSNHSKKLIVNNNSSSDSVKYFESLISLIFFLPEMERLFLNSPSVKRNFIDRLIYNSDKNYNQLINSYKKNILERNKILKDYKYDNNWIKEIEKKIVNLGIKIYDKRLEHLSIINLNLRELKSFKEYYYRVVLSIHDDLIQDVKYSINEIYEQYLSNLEKNRYFDSVFGGCKIGPHKSDISGHNIEDNFNVKHFSTGQQKTLILLIILAQCKFLIKDLNVKPIILFDEVCSHLDNENREVLLDLIETLNVQTFMTGTEKNYFSFLSTKASYCNISET